MNNQIFSLGQLLKINWNRMSELSGMSDIKEPEKTELRCRCQIQNKFACRGEEKETREIIEWMNNKTKINVKIYL